MSMGVILLIISVLGMIISLILMAVVSLKGKRKEEELKNIIHNEYNARL